MRWDGEDHANGYGCEYSNIPEAQMGEDGFTIVAGKKKKYNANLKRARVFSVQC